MGVPKRVYIKVVVEFSPEGLATPVRMEYSDRWFDIDDRPVRVERRAPASGGGGMLRYEVRVYGKTRYLWRDGDKWFVEVAAP
ncbi:conserved hypothetical protein [uncultured Eubacteriales bacterium]|uniref:Uncharacterized protein n=1 Tax=uncultured Eubacteriales bacterium TaxID=172733 RepID=A0A212JSP4_9FIRM|nr:conserved hypothetical protein [uncultured Eubacteriales bacterium]